MVIKLNQHQRCCILACTKFECSFISEGENSPIQFHCHMATSTIEGCWFNCKIKFLILLTPLIMFIYFHFNFGIRRGRMVGGFITTYAIRAYHH